MTFFAYKCRVKRDILKVNRSLAKNMVGKVVYILPETVKYVPLLHDFRFNILSEDIPSENGVSTLCSRFLRPLTPEAEEILQQVEVEAQ